MAVEKRNGKWYIRGKLKKEDGSYYEYRRLAKRCYKKSEAEAYELKFRENYQQENVIHIRKQKTFETVAGEMLADSNDIKYSTVRTDMDIFKKVNESIGNKNINLITSETLQRLIRRFEEKHSERYVKNIYYTINKVFKYSIFKGYIKVNPLEKVKRKIDKDSIKKEMLFWEPSEFDLFIDNVDDVEMKAFFVFSYWMGTRRSETLALQWKDIDFNSRSVSVYKTVTQRAKDTSWAITTPKRKNSIRTITMPETVVDALKELYKIQEVMYEFSGEVYLFGYFRPMGLDRPRRYLKKVMQSVNESADRKLPDIRIHDLRHSHASYLINNMRDQYSVYDVAKRLGDTVDTVLDTYAHWFKDADKKLVEAIDKQTGTNECQTGFSQLIELKKLLDMGVITSADYDAKKRQILGI